MKCQNPTGKCGLTPKCEYACSLRVQPAQTREHITAADCWCLPTIDYTDPETGISVFIHRKPQ